MCVPVCDWKSIFSFSCICVCLPVLACVPVLAWLLCLMSGSSSVVCCAVYGKTVGEWLWMIFAGALGHRWIMYVCQCSFCVCMCRHVWVRVLRYLVIALCVWKVRKYFKVVSVCVDVCVLRYEAFEEPESALVPPCRSNVCVCVCVCELHRVPRPHGSSLTSIRGEGSQD